MIPITTPKGTFRVRTKRVGDNSSLKLLLLHGGPGGSAWEHDSGPPGGSGWADLFAETPNYRGLGRARLAPESAAPEPRGDGRRP